MVLIGSVIMAVDALRCLLHDLGRLNLGLSHGLAGLFFHLLLADDFDRVLILCFLLDDLVQGVLVRGHSIALVEV
jgi:hypothetical protein